MGAIFSIVSRGEPDTTGGSHSNGHVDQTELQRSVTAHTQVTTPKQEDILQRSTSSSPSVDGEQCPDQPRAATTSHTEDGVNGQVGEPEPEEPSSEIAVMETDRIIVANDTMTAPYSENEVPPCPSATTTSQEEIVDKSGHMHQESVITPKILSLDDNSHLMLSAPTDAGIEIDNGVSRHARQQLSRVLPNIREQSVDIRASGFVVHSMEVRPSDQPPVIIESPLQHTTIDAGIGDHSTSGLLQPDEPVDGVSSTVHGDASLQSSGRQGTAETKNTSAIHNPVLPLHPKDGDHQDVFAFRYETSSTPTGTRLKFQPRGKGKLPLRKPDKKRAADGNIDKTCIKKPRSEDKYLDTDAVEKPWPSYKSHELTREEQKVVANELLLKSQQKNKEKYQERLREISKRSEDQRRKEREEDRRFEKLTGWRRSPIE